VTRYIGGSEFPFQVAWQISLPNSPAKFPFKAEKEPHKSLFNEKMFDFFIEPTQRF